MRRGHPSAYFCHGAAPVFGDVALQLPPRDIYRDSGILCRNQHLIEIGQTLRLSECILDVRICNYRISVRVTKPMLVIAH
jgi:hypothetical protein